MGGCWRKAAPGAYVTLSHEILREYGEYERMSTTVLNAYIGPRIRTYLDELERLLRDDGFDGELLIMQSNGGVMAPSTARTLPVATLESGPVGGFIAAARTACRLGYPNAIAFDMGGTTAKTNLVRDGEPQMAHGYHIGGYASGHPMTLPVVDTVEVGSGGGSIARADGWRAARRTAERGRRARAGLLRQGRHRADGHRRQSRARPHRSARISRRRDDARRRCARAPRSPACGGPLGSLGRSRGALAIVKIAVLHMSLAVRQVSVERGYDPRDFAMLAFGGAGPLHAVEVARALHIPAIIVPNFPGQFSAAGMLMADLRHDYVRTYYKPLDRADFGELREIADEVESLARERLARDPPPSSITISKFAMPARTSRFPCQSARSFSTRATQMSSVRLSMHSISASSDITIRRSPGTGERPVGRYRRA